MIRFLCPRCRTKLQVPPRLIGVVVRCSSCAQGMRVPPAPVARLVPSLSPRPRQAPPLLPRPRPPLPAPKVRTRPRALLVASFAAVLLLAGLTGVAYVMKDRARADEQQAHKADPPPLDQEPAEKKADKPPPENVAPKTREVPPPPPPRANDLEGKVLAAINDRRAATGAAPLTLHDDHARGCREHAAYLAKNWPDHAGLDPHSQDDSLPGATPGGTSAAVNASVARREPLDAVNAWLAAPLHRDRLLDPDLKTIGVGFSRDNGTWVTVLDWQRGGQTKADDSGAVLFPAPRQPDVPLAFTGNEVPDPLPDAPDKLVGYPVTATFPRGITLTAAAVRLEDENGDEVTGWFSSPEKPANRTAVSVQQNTLCLFAKQPLVPGRRYLVRMSARLNNRDWSHVWTFTTASPDAVTTAAYRRVLTRINDLRKQAGLGAVRLDEAKSRGCLAHAAYLARHLDRTPNVRLDQENPDLEGYSEEGNETARYAAIRLGGGPGAADAVDWMMASVLNRHLILNPSLETIGVGSALQAQRGWLWVLATEKKSRRTEGDTAVLYPSPSARDVPLYFGREVNEVVADHPKGQPGGFATSANFHFGARVQGVKARLLAEGNVVECYLSTPTAPLPGSGPYKQILLIPKKPLTSKTTYTVEASADVDGKPWSKTWSFTTLDVERYVQTTGERLRDQLNDLRKRAGLQPVELDERLSRGCQSHAKYVVRNLDHPKLAGLGIHDEDESLPGYSAEGARAGRRSVIAQQSEPGDSVANWMATLYHRVPLLDPAIRRIGWGQEWHPLRGWVTVLEPAGP